MNVGLWRIVGVVVASVVFVFLEKRTIKRSPLNVCCRLSRQTFGVVQRPIYVTDQC